MVKIWSDFIIWNLHARDATWREATSDTWLKFSHNLKSRGPDQQLQRRQRVYRQLGVQHALVLVQTKFGNIVVTSLLKILILDPSGQLTYSN